MVRKGQHETKRSQVRTMCTACAKKIWNLCRMMDGCRCLLKCEKYFYLIFVFKIVKWLKSICGGRHLRMLALVHPQVQMLICACTKLLADVKSATTDTFWPLIEMLFVVVISDQLASVSDLPLVCMHGVWMEGHFSVVTFLLRGVWIPWLNFSPCRIGCLDTD